MPIALALAATSLAGCSLAPVYHQPAVPSAASYKEVPGWQPAGAAVAPAGKWWQAFNDPTLNALEELLLHLEAHVILLAHAFLEDLEDDGPAEVRV